MTGSKKDWGLSYHEDGKELLKIYRSSQGKFSEENLKFANSMGYTFKNLDSI